jgi:hypothetical protein
MMFYESERIVNKQLKHIKLRAYNIIQELEVKGLDDREIMACINLLLKDDSSEFQKDILEFALKTVTLRQEQTDVQAMDHSTYCFIDGRVQPRKVSPAEPSDATKSAKRKAFRGDKNRASD